MSSEDDRSSERASHQGTGLSEKRWVVWPDTPGRPGEEGRVS